VPGAKVDAVSLDASMRFVPPNLPVYRRRFRNIRSHMSRGIVLT
jgi:hypothetical protein